MHGFSGETQITSAFTQGLQLLAVFNVDEFVEAADRKDQEVDGVVGED
jgi:hypothetical protein